MMKRLAVFLTLMLFVAIFSGALDEAAAVTSLVGTWGGTAIAMKYDGKTATKSTQKVTFYIKGQSGTLFYGTMSGAGDSGKTMNFTGNISGSAVTITIQSPSWVDTTFGPEFSKIPGACTVNVNGKWYNGATTTKLTGHGPNGEATDTYSVLNGTLSGTKTISGVVNASGSETITVTLIKQ